MTSTHLVFHHFALGAALVLAACSNEGPELPTDLGSEVMDAGQDAGAIEDLGAEDAGGAPDMGGPIDMGFPDAGGIDPEAEPFRTLSSSGQPEQRVDLVFVGDGYTLEELNTSYVRHIERVANYMFTRQSRGATEPFYQHRALFNVHRVHLASNESGVDDPSSGTTRDTALDGTSACAPGALCLVDTAKARAAVDEALEGSGIVPDLIIVTLNTELPLEDAIIDENGQFAVYGGGTPTGVDLNISERGLRQVARALANLALHDPGTEAYSGEEPDAPNVSTSSTGEKWSAWLGFDADFDGQGAVSAFEGGGGFATGLYRPVPMSKLTGAIGEPFDPVAREAIVYAIYELVPVLTGHTPNDSPVMNPDVLDAFSVEPSLVEVNWFVDGANVNVPGDRFGFNSWASGMNLSAGLHTVAAQATAQRRFDFPDCRRCQSAEIPFVRTSTPTMIQTVTWEVNYSP